MQGDAVAERVPAQPETMRMNSVGTAVLMPVRERTDEEQTRTPRALKARLVAADMAAVVVGMLLAFGWRHVLRGDDDVLGTHVVLATITLPVWLGAFAMNRLYLARAVARHSEELRRIANSTIIVIGVMVTVAFALQFKSLSRLWILSVALCVPACLVIERLVARRIFARLRRTGAIVRPVLIIGTDAEAIALMHATQRRPELGYRIVGFVGNDDIGARGGCEVLGGLDDTETVLAATGATGAMISLPSVDPEHVNRLTRRLTDGGYHVALSSGLRDIDVARFRPQDLNGRTLLYVEQTIREGWRAVAKRAFDVVVAVLALIVTAPLLLAAAIAIKLESKGPVMFSQERVGLNGRVFRLVKLRTMCVDAEARRAELEAQNEADGPMFKIAKDPRITRVGAVLRKFSIDELPQFVNVLRGEMSVVGPRPALPREVEQWSDDVHGRLRVMPGITGMWQVSGRSDTSFDEYKRLDQFYVDNWTLAHDLRIVMKTVRAVVTGSGAR